MVYMWLHLYGVLGNECAENLLKPLLEGMKTAQEKRTLIRSHEGQRGIGKLPRQTKTVIEGRQESPEGAQDGPRGIHDHIDHTTHNARDI